MLFSYLENQNQIEKNENENENENSIILNIFHFVNNYKRNKDINIQNVIRTLQHYKLKINGTNKLLLRRLYNFGKILVNHKKNNLSIIMKLQQTYRKYLKRRIAQYNKYTIKEWNKAF